jgi:phosphoribosylaminoimidazole-succinocarboxamide synthase
MLTQISNHWFKLTEKLLPNHLLPDQARGNRNAVASPTAICSCARMIVRKLKPLTIECVVRGYLVGSGWSSYQKTGEISGVKLARRTPARRSQLPEPLFTPTTKAPKGQHDEPITDAQGAAAIGAAALPEGEGRES